MPSGHSQFIWFFCVFLIMYCYEKKQYLNIIGLILLALTVSISRLGVYHLGAQCHSPLQITIGGLIGSILAILSYKLLKKLRF